MNDRALLTDNDRIDHDETPKKAQLQRLRRVHFMWPISVVQLRHSA